MEPTSRFRARLSDPPALLRRATYTRIALQCTNLYAVLAVVAVVAAG